MYMVMTELHSAGLPHSDIRGSQVACTSPRLFAACHVLHRLPEPQASAVRPFLLLAVRHSTLTGCAAHTFGFLVLFSFLFQYVKELAPQRGRVENNGFEPLTPCLQSRCSSQLS